MKIQIDTIAKTIKVEESVNLGELTEALDKLLPDVWKEYTLMTGVTIEWVDKNPIYPYFPIYPNYPATPLDPIYRWPVITCKSNGVINAQM